ncbi:MAG: FHA domain-containing protein [Bdellovibrionales bacterium]|nr:FHA domain-containing protein [Bdellovibrionales bacterium]
MVSQSKFAPRLVIIEGHEKGKVIPLTDGTAIIGRSKGDVIVHDARVSRSHVAIQFDEKKGVLTFTDLKSLNGTFLNGEEKKEGQIADGDRLQVGDTIFDCQMTKPDTSVDISESLRRNRAKDDIAQQYIEPEEEDLEDVSLAPEPHADGTPNLSALSHAVQEPDVRTVAKKRKRVVSLRSWYLKIPVRKRIQLLSLVTILIGVGYLGLDDRGSKTTSVRVEAIRRQAEQGQLGEAVLAAQQYQAKNPADPNGFILLGDLYALQNDYQKAVLAYQKAATFSNVSPVVHVKLIRQYLVTQNNAAAVEEYTRLGEAIQNVGRILGEAIKDKKMSASDAVAQNPFIRDLFVETAQLFLDFKELEEPPQQLMLIARALQKDIAPDDPVGYKLEAQLLFQQNQTESAVALLDKAYALNPRDRWVIENLALAKYRLKDYEGTERVLRAWIDNFPDSTRAYLTMAYLKFTQKDAKAALPFLQKIIEVGNRNPKETYYPEALYWVGQVLLQDQRLGEATQYVQQSCQLGYELGCQSPLLQRVPTSPNGSETQNGQ